MKPHSLSLRTLVCVSLSAALIAVSAWLSIPLTVPFTLQSGVVCLIALLLGRRRAVLSVMVYLLLGTAGLPVFAGFRGGLGVLTGVTGGYLMGFLLTALIAGAAAELFAPRPLPLLAGMAAGMLACYALGTGWFLVLYTRSTGAIGLASVLSMCVFPYLLPDACKCLLAYGLYRRLRAPLRSMLSR